MKGQKCVAVGLLLFISLGAGAVLAESTGKLVGRVLDDKNAPLPGATVTIKSNALIGGPRRLVTGGDGAFSFPALDPGLYTIVVELPGFMLQEINEVQLRLDRTTEINVQMPVAKYGDAVTVMAITPVVDPTQVSTSQTFTSEMLSGVAIGSARRSYQNVLDMVPGVVAADGNPNVYGSTGGENAYFIDGLDTTDPVTATFGINFNFDAIGEISFQTGGFEAEYGRATGGVVNVVTKSGGNDFSGTFDLRYRSTRFYQNGDHFDRDSRRVRFFDPAATLGGPIVRDRVWFFLSAEAVDSQLTPENSPTTTKYKGKNYLGKLTWQADDNWRLVAKVSGDPANIDNSDASGYVAREATTFQRQGGAVYQAELAGVFTASLLWNLEFGINRQNLDAYSQRRDFTTISHFNRALLTLTGNAANAQYSSRDREEIKTNLIYFTDSPAGSHEFKGGLEYTALRFDNHNYTTAGGYRYEDDADANRNSVPYFLIYDEDQGWIKNRGALATAYLQDAWRILPTLTAKIGVRYEAVEYKNDAGKKVAALSKLQPRIGIAWDIKGDAKQLARIAWGRYLHPNALTLPNFARTKPARSTYWASCTSLGVSSVQECKDFAADEGSSWTAGPDRWDPYGWWEYETAGGVNIIAKHLRPTYAEEFVAGYQWEFFPRTAIEVVVVDKKTKDIFEDTCNGNLPKADAKGACDFFVMANLPGLERKYRGAIFKFESRATDWLHLLFSYTWSKSQGNIEYTQNSGTDFDIYPVHWVNRYGYLSDDRRHRVKLNGYVNLPYDIQLGIDAFWSSPFNYNRTTLLGDDLPYGERYLDGRGSHRRSSNAQLDVQLSKSFRLGEARAAMIASVYNLFNSEQVVGVCENDEGCNTAGGSFTPWGGANAWQNPRSFELGFRFEF